MECSLPGSSTHGIFHARLLEWGAIALLRHRGFRYLQVFISVIKEINPEYSLKGLMVKLKLQYCGHLFRRTDSLEKTRPWCWERLRVGEEHDRGWDGWMASLTQWTWVWACSRRWWRARTPAVLQSWGSQRVGQGLWLNSNKLPYGESTFAGPIVPFSNKVSCTWHISEKSRLLSRLFSSHLLCFSADVESVKLFSDLA